MNDASSQRGEAALRPLEIDFEELVTAMTWRDDAMLGVSYRLDLETGEVIFVSQDNEDGAEGDAERGVEVEPIESHEAFRIMEDFVDTQGTSSLARQLADALRQRSPFRRFKDVLTRNPDQREAWFDFERVAHERMARDWCESLGIRPIWTGLRVPGNDAAPGSTKKG